jgi:hypothetical protein
VVLRHGEKWSLLLLLLFLLLLLTLYKRYSLDDEQDCLFTVNQTGNHRGLFYMETIRLWVTRAFCQPGPYRLLEFKDFWSYVSMPTSKVKLSLCLTD